MKERLDIILVKKGLFPSREKAKGSVMAGLVYVDGRRVDKPGAPVDIFSEITVKEEACPYVSRGGLKLEKALKTFDISPKGARAADIGASTGGFTDCMLQKGAVSVLAVDVGYGQLDWKLRNDPRVINMEKTNIRYMDTDAMEDSLDLITIDVSFISLRLVLPVAARLLSHEGSILCLVKPQFEAGRDQVGKKGIVRDPSVHLQVLEKVCSYGAENGLFICGLDFSPVKGTKGNIEYLMHLKKKPPQSRITEEDMRRTVSLSHEMLSDIRAAGKGEKQ